MSKTILLDGGMGQELLSRSKRPATPMWSADIMLHEPSLVRDLHLDFILSGADVITLNTYTATPTRLARQNALSKMQELHTMAMTAAKEAKALSGKKELRIAGCLPPLVASYRPEFALPYEESLESYRTLVTLQNPASDLFICETMSSIDEAKAACIAGLESDKPVWLGLTVQDDEPELLRSGESLAEALSVFESMPIEAIVLNCSQPEAIDACWPLLQQSTKKIGAYANGFVSVTSLYPGDTVEELQSRKDLSPEHYADYVMSWVGRGASIIGGCCEIGPAHIQAIHARLGKQS
jgi:S-methylmethionine-dependent homocysteine/selenocysteine methylase